MRRRTLIRAAVAAAVLPAAAARAQADWPNRTIRWIVPYGPGTAPDQSVRVVAEALSNVLGQRVIVENKAGAGGNIGAQLAARAAPDGYTWVYAAAPMATNMRLHRSPGFDALKDFVHVARIGTSDSLLIAHPASGMRTVRDLVERARREPGRLNYASGGVGTPAHMGAELMLSVAGVEATHVPFKGAVEATNAVMNREVDFSLPILQVALPHVKAGRLVALAVAGPKRNPKLPEVPTLVEAGLAGVSLVSFGGVSLPAGAPPEIVARLNAAVRDVLSKPEVLARLDTGGVTSPSTPEEFTRDFVAEMANTERMMRVAKLEPQ